MEWKETQYQAKEQSSYGTVSMVSQRNKSTLSTSPLGHYLGIPTVVVIPWAVVKELDKLKTNSDDCQSAREVQRILDCMKNKSSIHFQEAKRSWEIVDSLEI
ncbi:hypothetical protein J6590_085426 [Homalodisca vitripennis]|nr:hypothetical protein J6590_085426 [Homalodisca vitripennis]